jgi:hypothetical protein
MSEHAKGQPPQPTHSIRQFDMLIGEWTMVGAHPQLPSTLHGHSSFAWLRDGALLTWRFDWDPDCGIPNAFSVIGHDDAGDACSMLYTDARGVARIYQMALSNGVWKQWRDSPDFAQRMAATFSDDGNTITWRGELSKDGGSTWEPDLSGTFTRK